MSYPRIELGNRAQTTQDFALGIGLFLLVVVFVLTFVPSVLAPFGSVADDERAAQAERVAVVIVSDTTVDGERLLLNHTDLQSELSPLEPTTYGLPSHVQLNVTLHTLEDDQQVASGGPSYTGQSAASWTRIVTTTDESCEAGCRLVVRVW